MSSGLTAFPFIYVLLVAFWTVLVVELVGDKSLYSTTSLSLRFRPGPIFVGIAIAFGAKMLVAVLLAKLLVRLHFWTDLLSAVAFFLSALFVWLKEPEPAQKELPANPAWLRAVAISFASLFFTEWGDPGQIATGALAAKSHLFLAPWLGGTLAMSAKGGLAVLVGAKLRDGLPLQALRALATASFCVLGILALRGFIFR